MLKTRYAFLLLLLGGTIAYAQTADPAAWQRYGVAPRSGSSSNGDSTPENGGSLEHRPMDLLRRLGTSDYDILPGDIFTIAISQYVGTTGQTQLVELQLVLEDDYTLQIPSIGPIDASDLSFNKLRRHVIAVIKDSQPVQYVNLDLTAPALFDVYVTGGVVSPGRITVDGFTRLSDAIALAGGPADQSSLRQIRFEGASETRAVDLSLFVQSLEDLHNPLLRPGDRIHVPYADILVTVEGRVRFPGRYEMLPGETLEDLLGSAGGASPGALEESIQITRIDDEGRWSILSVDPTQRGEVPMRHGDRVTIRSEIENAPMVTVEGAVFGEVVSADAPTPIPLNRITSLIPYTPGLTALGVLEQLGGPTPYALAAKSYIRRADGEKIALDAASLWDLRDSALDVALAPDDYLLIPMRVMNVAVTGEVSRPSIYGYTRGYTVADYLRSAGGVNPSRGRTDIVFLLDDTGARRRVGLEAEPEPGDTIVVDKRALAKVGDFFSSNVFVIAGLVTSIIAIVNTVWDLIDRVAAATTPATQ